MQNELVSQKVRAEDLEHKLLVFTLLAMAVIALLFLAQLAARQRLVMQLKKQHKEIEVKNRLLEDQKEEIQAQANQLEESNYKITQINESLNLVKNQLEVKNLELVFINENLDNLVKARVAEIAEKNIQISQYAFINAHKLRSPLAGILGIVSLMKHDKSPTDSDLLYHLELSSQKLEEIISEIQELLHEKADKTLHKK